MIFRKMPAPFATPTGISGIFGRMESAPGFIPTSTRSPRIRIFRAQPVPEVQEKERRGREATTPFIPKVCENLVMSSRSDVEQNMLAKQISSQAGGLRNFLA